MLYGTSRPSLLGNLFTGKCKIRGCEGKLEQQTCFMLPNL